MSDETVRENGNETIRETQNSDATVREGQQKEIERPESASMLDYTEGFYKRQWGYDEVSVEVINSSLETFRRQIESASYLERLQLELWIAYLESLSKRDYPLSDEDKLILKNVSLKETETLAKLISARNIETLRLVLQRYTETKSEYLKNFLEFCVNGSTQKVIDAINIGIDVNIKDKGCDTALMRAARYGYLEIVKVLIKAGADVNAKSSRGSALIFAAKYGHIEIINMLIKAGADVNVKDVYGETALMKAAKSSNAETVNVLLNAGAKVKKKVLSYARENKMLQGTDVLERLEQLCK